MSATHAVLHARQVKQRLRFPPNAVPDYGIDLSRKSEPIPYVIAPVAVPPKIETINSISSRIAALSLELDALIEKHEDMTWEVMKQRAPRVEDIQFVVARYYGFTRVELRSPRRDANTVYARHVAMYLAKKLTQRSYPDIGRRFGGKDHTTVMSAIKRIEAQRATDTKLCEEIDYLFTAFPQAN